MARIMVQSSTKDSSNIVSVKDENGQYLPPRMVKATEDLSIDKILTEILITLNHSVGYIAAKVKSGDFCRDDIAMLKDCAAMLHELKKKEDELIEDMSDEDLDKLIKK